MKQVITKDNSPKAKDAFSQIPKTVGRILGKTLKELEEEGVFVFPASLRDADDITGEQMVLFKDRDNFVSGNVMGFIGCEDERLVISSRFDNGQDYFLQYLLGKVMDLPNIVNLETDSNQENELFNMLLFLFPAYLKKAIRNGLYKQYVRNYYNDANVSGTIEIARHIKSNTPFLGRVAYSKKEFSFDNYLMELIRHTVEFIQKRPYGENVLGGINDEVKQIVASTPTYRQQDRRRIIEENKKNPLRHAFYREYLPLQQLCLMILQNRKHQIGSGSQKIYGVLFDGAWLWEEYVFSLTKEFFYHPMNKAGRNAQYLFTNAENRREGRIFPDFIGKNEENRIIADAKYKPSKNIGNKDYLQILAYMLRFDGKNGVFLYPETSEAKSEVLRINRGSSYHDNVGPRDELFVMKQGFMVPERTEDYVDFSEKMKISEREFKDRLLICLGSLYE